MYRGVDDVIDARRAGPSASTGVFRHADKESRPEYTTINTTRAARP
jgi:hypothetical protein